MLVASHSTHRCNHHPDDQREVEETAEEMEEAEEVEEAVYLLQQYPACSHHTDEPWTLTNFWAVNQKHSPETGRKSNPS
jgi:hypothetical protein